MCLRICGCGQVVHARFAYGIQYFPPTSKMLGMALVGRWQYHDCDRIMVSLKAGDINGQCFAINCSLISAFFFISTYFLTIQKYNMHVLNSPSLRHASQPQNIHTIAIYISSWVESVVSELFLRCMQKQTLAHKFIRPWVHATYPTRDEWKLLTL